MFAAIRNWWSAPSRRELRVLDALDDVLRAILIVNRSHRSIMSNLNALNDTVESLVATSTSLQATVAEANATLRTLAEAVLALRADAPPADFETQIKTLQEKAALVLANVEAAGASLAAAEDEADNVLPPPAPVDIPLDNPPPAGEEVPIA